MAVDENPQVVIAIKCECLVGLVVEEGGLDLRGEVVVVASKPRLCSLAVGCVVVAQQLVVDGEVEVVVVLIQTLDRVVGRVETGHTSAGGVIHMVPLIKVDST